MIVTATADFAHTAALSPAAGSVGPKNIDRKAEYGGGVLPETLAYDQALSEDQCKRTGSRR